MSAAPPSPAAHRLRLHEILPWLCGVGAYFVFPDYLALGGQILIMALFALSLDLVLGYAGIVTLGHAAFFGTGAYVAGILAARGWTEPLSLLVASGAVSCLLGVVTGAIVLRTAGLSLLMVTLVVSELLQETANRLGWLTGGADGLQGVKTWPLLGLFKFDLYGFTAYWYALIVLFLLFLVCRRLINSPFGLSLRGIRENAVRMRAIGAESRPHIRTIYTISATIAGIAGAILTQTTETVSLGVLDFQRSADLLVILILGGAGRLYGGLIGAIIYMIARDWFSGVNPQYWYFPIGILLIAVVLFLPNGILGGIAQLIGTERGQRWFGWLTSPTWMSSLWRRRA
jgi:branched-chain amino acid transport system permease protein